MRTRQVRKSHSQANAVSGARPLSPHLEFLNRHVGSLPEAINGTQLETLNEALRILFDRLREARRQFEEEDDHGRTGAFTALGGLWQFIVLFEEGKAGTLEVPLLRLQDALVSLDAGSVQPIVEKQKRRLGGRPPSSHGYMALKGHVAGTVKQLVNAGLSRNDAHQRVAKQLKQLGVRSERGPGHVTATTVRNWCDEVSVDVNRQGTAAMMHDSMFTELEQQRLSSLSHTEARRFASASLSAWTLSIFPELKKLANPRS